MEPVADGGEPLRRLPAASSASDVIGRVRGGGEMRAAGAGTDSRHTVGRGGTVDRVIHLRQLAATDMRSAIEYENRVRAFHGELRSFFYPLLFQEQLFDPNKLTDLPQFYPGT